MSYIFMDESGDFGFTKGVKGSSKFFFVTFLFIDQERPFEKIIRKIHGSMRRKWKMRTEVLHASHEEPATILKTLRLLAEKDNCKIMTIYLNKKRVYTKMQNEKHVLYNYITNILLDRIMTQKLVDRDEKIHFTASRRETNKYLNNNFKSYIGTELQKNHGIDMDIMIKTPSESKCLQLVDIISWAIARKYEQGDESYYEIIKDLIVEENPLFPHK